MDNFIKVNKALSKKLVEHGFYNSLIKIEGDNYYFEPLTEIENMVELYKIDMKKVVSDALVDVIDTTKPDINVEPNVSAAEPIQTVKPAPEPRLYEVYSLWVKDALVNNGLTVVKTGVSSKTGNTTYFFDDTAEFRTLFDNVKLGKYLKNKTTKPVEKPINNNVEDSPVVDSGLSADDKRFLFKVLRTKKDELLALGVNDSMMFNKMDNIMDKLKDNKIYSLSLPKSPDNIKELLKGAVKPELLNGNIKPYFNMVQPMKMPIVRDRGDKE